MINLDYDPAKAAPPEHLVKTAETILPLGLDPASLVQIVPFDPSWPDGETWSLRLKVPGGRNGDMLQMTATYDSTEQSLDLLWMNVDATKRRTGLGTRALANLVACADQMGVEKITLAATTDGALAWLRFGFVPNGDDWHDPADGGLRQKLAARIDHQHTALDNWGRQDTQNMAIVDRLRDMAARWQDEDAANSPGTPSDIGVLTMLGRDEDGRKIAETLMKGISWHGHLSLAPNDNSRQQFNHYISDKIGHQSYANRSSPATTAPTANFALASRR